MLSNWFVFFIVKGMTLKSLSNRKNIFLSQSAQSPNLCKGSTSNIRSF